MERAIVDALAHAETIAKPCKRAATTSECAFLEADKSQWCARCLAMELFDVEADLVILADAYRAAMAILDLSSADQKDESQ